MNQRVVTGLALVVLAAVGHLIAYYVVRIPTQLEAVILLGLLLFYPLVRNPILGVYCVFILGPFIMYVRRLYYLAYGRPTQDPLIAVPEMLLSFMLIGLYFEFRDRGDKDRAMRGFVVALMVYFGYLFLRTFVGNYLAPGEALLNFKFYGPPVLFFFIGMVFAHKRESLKSLWVITIVIGVIAALYGLKQLYIGYSRAEHLWFASTSFTSLFIKGVARPFSTFQAPAAFADYGIIAVLGVLMVVSWGRGPGRLSLLLVLPLLFYGVLITSVRSSWIGLASALGVWFIVRRVSGMAPRIWLMVGFVAAYLVYQILFEGRGGGGGGGTLNNLAQAVSGQQYLDLLVTTRVSAVTNPLGEYSFLSRVALWRELLVLSVDPQMAVLGRGLGTQRADSLYFTYLAEFGYPGVVFIIWILIAFIKKGLYIVDRTGSEDVRALACGITVLNIVVAIMSITGTHIHSFPGDVYFWFWNGVLVKTATEPALMMPAVPANEDTGNA